MQINETSFDFVKLRGEELYKGFERINCPYFNELVYFNAQGLDHLIYKRTDKERLEQDCRMRFKLLYLAPVILRLTRTLQGFSCRKGFERVRRNGVIKHIAVERRYYEFIAIIDSVRVRIIVKQVDSGQFMFWSIIPFWNRVGESKRIDFGDPEED